MDFLGQLIELFSDHCIDLFFFFLLLVQGKDVGKVDIVDVNWVIMHTPGLQIVVFMDGERLWKLFAVSSYFSKIKSGVLLVIPSTALLVVIPLLVSLNGLSIA